MTGRILLRYPAVATQVPHLPRYVCIAPPPLLYISSPHDTVYYKLPFSHTLVLDQVPTANQLHLVQQIGDPPTSSSYPMPSCSTTVPTLPPFEKTSTPLYIGGGMPPIPAKLAKRIQEGLFVEMAELMPDYLRSPNPSDEDHSKPKNWEITNIVDWIQCFSLYIAVVCRSQPQRIADLLGYQNLIITSHQRFPDFNWATYDREFRQQAAARTIPHWSVLDNTLWNLARQSTTHSSTTQFTRQPYKIQQTEKTYRSQLPPTITQPRIAPICLDWNKNPTAGCSHLNCRYNHTCYRCIHTPGIPDKHHKAIYCPHKGKKSSTAFFTKHQSST